MHNELKITDMQTLESNKKNTEESVNPISFNLPDFTTDSYKDAFAPLLSPITPDLLKSSVSQAVGAWPSRLQPSGIIPLMHSFGRSSPTNSGFKASIKLVSANEA